MKKNILFVMNNLHCGGAEKALISLLETIDYSRFNVDLLLFKQEGLFLNKVPENVNLLEEPVGYKLFDMPIQLALKNCFKEGNYHLALLRIMVGLVFKIEKNRAKCEQLIWKLLSKTLQPLNKKYDVAIGYLEKNPIYFCIEKVESTKKIGFIHNDYIKLGMDPKIDNNYFSYLDRIVTVSEECANVLRDTFPVYESKIEVMYNIVSPKVIKKLSFEKQGLGYKGVKIVSVGRLTYQKGFEMAIEACNILVENGYDITWYIVGEGEERKNLERVIYRSGLKDNLLLLGIKDNPYPYIKEADIFVQPSRFEGKSIAIDEAKILNKPIVVTNFSTAKDQIVNGENGLIVDMNPQSIYEGIRKLIDNKGLREKFSHNLSTEDLGTEYEIEKLYQFFSAV